MPDTGPADASVRNSLPILGVLEDEFRDRRRVLEIGSGTAQHALTFARELRHLVWQASDLDERLAWISEAIARANLDNLPPPLSLDVRDAALPPASYDAVYSCNTAHIMSLAAVEKMLQLAGHALVEGGVLCCYGPFKRGGRFSTPSNEQFDAALRSQNPEMGIRELSEIDRLASAAGLTRLRIYAMPANNLLVLWEKHPGGGRS